MIQLESLNVEYALVCDDVRREDNGKSIYIGVYPVDIALAEVPANLALRLVVRMQPRKAGKLKLECRVLLDGAVATTFSGEAEFVVPSPADNYAFPPILVGLPHYGTLDFEFRQDESGPWKKVLSLPVNRPQTV